MKFFVTILMMLPFLFLTHYTYSQENCKVLMPEIDSIYTGKCKNGLAHGRGIAIGKDTYDGKFKKGWPDGDGIYTWSTGETFVGTFLDGVKDGEGSYTYFTNGADTTISGIWKNDVYLGPKPKKPSVKQAVSIDRYNFLKQSDTQNRVLITFYQNGGRNAGITDLFISADSGYEVTLGNSKGFKDMTFPVTMMVKYTTPNKLQTRMVICIMEFTIYEAGDWKVDIFN